MARTACMALAVVVVLGAAAVNSLEVTTPSEGQPVVADRTFTVEWTGSDRNSQYEIDLFYCGSSCAEDDCGDWLAALCTNERGCSDLQGNYDVVMPEPLDGASASGYKVRVMDIADESSVDCSAEFILVASDEAPSVGDADGPHLEVLSPEDGDMAFAGAEYTIEFDYDNGFGSSADRFSIDLYRADGGSGDCGTYVTSVCDKPSIGCRDSGGDYDVTIPEDTASGEYQIRVGRYEDEELFGCSGTFLVLSEDGDEMSMSFGFGAGDEDELGMSFSFSFGFEDEFNF